MKPTTFNTFNAYQQLEECLIDKFTSSNAKPEQFLKTAVDCLSDQELLSIVDLDTRQAWVQMCEKKTSKAAKTAVESLYNSRLDGGTGLFLWKIAFEVVELLAAKERAASHPTPSVQACARYETAARTAIVVAMAGHALAKAAGWQTWAGTRRVLKMEAAENAVMLKAWQRFGVINFSGENMADFNPCVHGCLPVSVA